MYESSHGIDFRRMISAYFNSQLEKNATSSSFSLLCNSYSSNDFYHFSFFFRKKEKKKKACTNMMRTNETTPREGEMRIMSVGPTGVGKSTIGNKLLGLKPKDSDYLKTGASAHSCTQEPKTIKSGNVAYTDLPGIPDTKPNNTKHFYDMIINEAKKPLTAIFFVFAVEMRMDQHTKARLKQCGLLFREINKSSAAKILILNDFNAWSNPEGLDEDDEEYLAEKAKHDKARHKSHKAFEQDIKRVTGINFFIRAVTYGLNKKINPGHNMDVIL